MTKSSRAAGEVLPPITGLASCFYNGDAGTEYTLFQYAGETCVERIMPGAFDQALTEGQDVRALFNHSPDVVLGRSTAGSLQLKKVAKGLHYEISPPRSEVGRSLVESISRGDVTQSSFAFVVTDQTFREIQQPDGNYLVIREVNSVDLLDVSPVTYPAYASTTCTVSGSSSRSVVPIGLAMRLDAVRDRARTVSLNEHHSYRGNYMHSRSIERAMGQRDVGAIIDHGRDDIERRRRDLAERRAKLPRLFPAHNRRVEEIAIQEEEEKLRRSEQALSGVEARAARRRNRTG